MHPHTRHGTPLLSVVMPVHNGLPFLDESISSIVNQTFTAFEFVILDDGSTDDSRRVLRAWEQKDPRIRIYTTDQKLGLAGSANLVVSKARGAIVARMDADDISHVDRLRRQWNIMESAPDVAAVGTLCNGIDGCGREVRPGIAGGWCAARVTYPFLMGQQCFGAACLIGSAVTIKTPFMAKTRICFRE